MSQFRRFCGDDEIAALLQELNDEGKIEFTIINYYYYFFYMKYTNKYYVKTSCYFYKHLSNTSLCIYII